MRRSLVCDRDITLNGCNTFSTRLINQRLCGSPRAERAVLILSVRVPTESNALQFTPKNTCSFPKPNTHKENALCIIMQMVVEGHVGDPEAGFILESVPELNEYRVTSFVSEVSPRKTPLKNKHTSSKFDAKGAVGLNQRRLLSLILVSLTDLKTVHREPWTLNLE